MSEDFDVNKKYEVFFNLENESDKLLESVNFLYQFTGEFEITSDLSDLLIQKLISTENLELIVLLLKLFIKYSDMKVFDLSVLRKNQNIIAKFNNIFLTYNSHYLELFELLLTIGFDADFIKYVLYTFIQLDIPYKDNILIDIVLIERKIVNCNELIKDEKKLIVGLFRADDEEFVCNYFKANKMLASKQSDDNDIYNNYIDSYIDFLNEKYKILKTTTITQILSLFVCLLKQMSSETISNILTLTTDICCSIDDLDTIEQLFVIHSHLFDLFMYDYELVNGVCVKCLNKYFCLLYNEGRVNQKMLFLETIIKLLGKTFLGNSSNYQKTLLILMDENIEILKTLITDFLFLETGNKYLVYLFFSCIHNILKKITETGTKNDIESSFINFLSESHVMFTEFLDECHNNNDVHFEFSSVQEDQPQNEDLWNVIADILYLLDEEL